MSSVKNHKIITVNGEIDPDNLGITLSHEHCLIDNTAVFIKPESNANSEIAYKQIDCVNAGKIRYNNLINYDNLLLNNFEMAKNELLNFKCAGGNSIIDATNVDLSRNPKLLKKISDEINLNIVMGSGYYVHIAQDLNKMANKTENDIANEIINDITNGVDDSGICSGLIGEIGCSFPINSSEVKVLKGAGLAQKYTGAPLQVHPGRDESSPEEILKILDSVGANLEKVAICHMERTIFDYYKCNNLAKTGCFLEYDLWGLEGYYPDSLSVTDIPNDAQRISRIKDLISDGYENKILLSHDICYKTRYSIFGGHGYSHILENAVPAMRKRNFTDNQINTLLVQNPKNFLAF